MPAGFTTLSKADCGDSLETCFSDTTAAGFSSSPETAFADSMEAGITDSTKVFVVDSTAAGFTNSPEANFADSLETGCDNLLKVSFALFIDTAFPNLTGMECFVSGAIFPSTGTGCSEPENNRVEFSVIAVGCKGTSILSSAALFACICIRGLVTLETR